MLAATARPPVCGASRPRLRRRRTAGVVDEQVVPGLVETPGGLFQRYGRQLALGVVDQPQPAQLAYAVGDLEVELSFPTPREPVLDAAVQLVGGERSLRGAQEVVGEHRLLDLFLLRGVEQVVEHAGVVVEVAEVEVVRQRLHELDLAVLELAELAHEEAAERREARTERDELALAELDRLATQPEPERQQQQ